MKKGLKTSILLLVVVSMILSFSVPHVVGASKRNKYNEKEYDFEKLKESYTQYLVGNEKINKSEQLDSKINNIHKTASNRYNTLLPEEDREVNNKKMLFKNMELGEDLNNLSKSFLYLYEISLATKTYKRENLSGNNFYQDKDVIEDIIDGLEWLYINAFEDQERGYYGNWYQWEIGMPMNITKTLMLLEDEINEINPELINKYIDSMDRYLRNGKNGDVDLESRFHTGANLADITTNRIIQGALLKNEDRIITSVDNLMTVFETIDPNNIINNNTDGFYEDGSFIQHHRVAYTGSYGKILLDRIVQAMRILDGTKYDRKEVLIPTVKDWIYKGFSPVIFEGYMMEIVKGRAIARTATGYRDVSTLIEAMVQISNFLDEQESNELQSHLKYIARSIKTDFTTNSFNSLESIVKFHEISNDPNIDPKNALNPEDHYAFNIMDKNVHVRDGYALALSRSSDRISKYEYMNGENLMPWFQGDGAYYLYLSGRNQAESFGSEYFTTVSPYKLPGTTVPIETRKTIPELYGGNFYYENQEHPLKFHASSESQNDYVYFPVGTNNYSGSVKLGQYGLAGIQLGDDIGYKEKEKGNLPDDFVVYKNANANKSYFMFDDEIVLLGSSIKDELNRNIMTTIDNRMFSTDETSNVVGETIDNKVLNNPDNGLYNLNWISFKTNKEGTQIGYYFPEGSQVSLSEEEVTENLRRIRASNPDKNVTKNFFTLGIEHNNTSKNDKYSYVLLPNFNEEETKEYSKNPNIRILENSSNVHGVENTKLNLKGFNFFTDKKKTVDNITSFNKASILVKEENNIITIAVSDPTFSLDKMKLDIQIPDSELIEQSDGVKTSVSRKKALIHIDSRNSYGKTFVIKLSAKGRN